MGYEAEQIEADVRIDRATKDIFQVSSPVIDLVRAAAAVQSVLRSLQWKYCFIGGLAVQHWGEPRLTRDIDVAIFTGFGSEKKFVEELLKHFEPRMKKAKSFAIRNRVLLVKTVTGVDLDISLGGIPFEERIVERAGDIEMLPGVVLTICSPEDLIVLKAFAAREIDWFDVRGIVARQGATRLDWAYVEEQLKPLAEAKEQPEILHKLRGIRGPRKGRKTRPRP